MGIPEGDTSHENIDTNLTTNRCRKDDYYNQQIKHWSLGTERNK